MYTWFILCGRGLTMQSLDIQEVNKETENNTFIKINNFDVIFLHFYVLQCTTNGEHFIFCIDIIIYILPIPSVPKVCASVPFLWILPLFCLFYEWALSKYCCSLFPLFAGLPSGPIRSDVECRGRQKLREGEKERSYWTLLEKWK